MLQVTQLQRGVRALRKLISLPAALFCLSLTYKYCWEITGQTIACWVQFKPAPGKHRYADGLTLDLSPLLHTATFMLPWLEKHPVPSSAKSAACYKAEISDQVRRPFLRVVLECLMLWEVHQVSLFHTLCFCRLGQRQGKRRTSSPTIIAFLLPQLKEKIVCIPRAEVRLHKTVSG